MRKLMDSLCEALARTVILLHEELGWSYAPAVAALIEGVEVELVTDAMERGTDEGCGDEFIEQLYEVLGKRVKLGYWPGEEQDD